MTFVFNQFLNQFLMLPQMVPFFFPSMAAYKTSKVESSDWVSTYTTSTNQ